MFLFSSHGSSLGPDSVLVIGLVLAEALEGLGLGRIINVGIIEEVLDPQKDLLMAGLQSFSSSRIERQTREKCFVKISSQSRS